MLHQDDYTQLIQRCYSAALDGAGWEPFLEDLRRLSGATAAQLRLGSLGVWATGDVEFKGLHTAGLRRGRVYDQSELGLLPPSASTGPWCRAITLHFGSGERGEMILARPSHRPDFRTIEGQILEKIAPHVEQSARLGLAHWVQSAAATRSAALAADLGGRWIQCDANGRVVAFCDHAPRWAEAQGIPLARGAPLRWGDADCDHLFQRAILGGAALPTMMPVPADPPVSVVLESCGAKGVLVRVRHRPRYQDMPADLVAAALTLTPSEARLVQRLCDGLSLVQAAQDLGWTEGSTRSCSKAIYGKLGVPGQVGLLTLVHHSAILLMAPRT